VDVGAGPGRFLADIGPKEARRVALDLAREALLRVDAPFRHHVVRGDGAAPPLAPGAFADVAVLGNALGFAGKQSERLLAEAETLVAPGGMLLIEVAPGPGERSRYLGRLPPSALARLLRSPVAAIAERAGREGFVAEPTRRKEPGDFRRFDPAALSARLVARGWREEEVIAVAPSLGGSPFSLEAIRPDPKAWAHLVELEERIGRRPERWAKAAAVLLSFSRALPSVGSVK
jgi:SAM-dependent methyltransferase